MSIRPRSLRSGAFALAGLTALAFASSVLMWRAAPASPSAIAAPAAPAAEPRWRHVMDGLFGDEVLDVVFVGEVARGNRSVMLLSEARGMGRGVFRLGEQGQWNPVQVHPQGERRRVRVMAPALDDNQGRIVYAGLEGQPRFAWTEDMGLHWSTRDGPSGPRRFDLLVSSESGRIYAAEAGTTELWTSMDRGETWVRHSAPGVSMPVEAFASTPDEPDVYMLAGGALYRTEDKPDGWTEVLGPSSTAPATVDLVAVGRRRYVYAVASVGGAVTLLTSDDRGDSWTDGGWPPVPARAHALAAGDLGLVLSTVWLGLGDGSVFQLALGDTSWVELDRLPIAPRRIVWDEATDDVWAGSTGLGLFRVSPAPIHTGAVSVEALSVAAPTYGDDALALLHARVQPERRDRFGQLQPELHAIYASTGGETWSRRALTVGLGADLVPSPGFSSNGRLYSGQMASDDAGASWRSLGAAPGGGVPHVLAVGPITGTHAVVYALREPYVDEDNGGGGLHRSEDGGASWEPCEVDTIGIVAAVVSPDYVKDLTAYVATFDGRLLKADDGLTFLQVSRIPSLDPARNLYDMAISPDFADDTTLVVAMDDASNPQRGHVYISSSGGEGQWQDRSQGLGQRTRPRRMLLSPGFGTDGVVFLGTMRRRSDPSLPSIYGSAGDFWFGELDLEPTAMEPSAVLDLAWGGALEDGRLFAAAGSAGLWLRDLTGVPEPPPTAAPSATSTDRPSATVTATPGGTPTPSPSATTTPVASASAVTPTATGAPTGSPTATAATATDAPSRTATATSTATSTATDVPTPTATPIPPTATATRTPAGPIYLPLTER